MEAKNILIKLKPFIIIILLFSLVFFLRAEAASISGVPEQSKAFFLDDTGLPYFSEMDSYYNYRLTENFIDHGYFGDTIKDGTDWDLHSFFPPGRSAEYPPLIVWITVFFYKLANLFGEYPLAVVCFWTPAIIASLCVIPAYLFVRKLSNEYGGIAAGILVGVATFYFSHTYAGFFDTDMFNMVLPLMVVWFFSESITTNENRRKMLFAVYAAIAMFIFSLAWEGWWYIFYLVVFVAIVYMLISKYLFKADSFTSWAKQPDKKQWLLEQPIILPLLIFVVLGLFLMFIYWGTSVFSSLLQPIAATKLQAATHGTSYPNVFISVGEMQIPDISTVVRDVGGILPFISGILGLAMFYWKLRIKKAKGKNKAKAPKKDRKPKRGRKSRRRKETKKEIIQEKNESPIITPEVRLNYLYYAILFTVWIMITAYAFTKGVRFVEAFSLPIALSAGIFVGFIADYLKKHIQKPHYHAITMVVIIAVVCYAPVSSAHTMATLVVPGTDDAMVDSLSWVRDNSPANAVMTSWWDFGHLFAAKADRAVTFDGGSQNNARAYWVGKALFTSNEDLSAGILKMLATSGDEGYSTLENYTGNTGKTVEIMDKILVVDRANALKILTSQYNLTKEQSEKVVKHTHPTNPNPSLFVTSMDMVGKAGWWSYFGSWNFDKENSTHYIYSIAQANASSENNSVKIMGQNNVTVHITGNNITGGLQISENQIAPPHRLIFFANGKAAVDTVINNQSTFSILVLYQDNNLITVAMNRELEDSMFTRLFFMQGSGLKRFKLAHKEPNQGISEVMVWNVN